MKKLLGSLVTFLLISLSLSVLTGTRISEAAFGTSPPWVNNEGMQPGTSFEQIINLSRNETDMAMKATIRFDGNQELQKWIEIQDQENLIMDVGQTILPMKVTINVPRTAGGGDYTGGIFVILAPTVAGAGGEVAIGLGAHVSVNITVLGEKKDVVPAAITPVVEKPKVVPVITYKDVIIPKPTPAKVVEPQKPVVAPPVIQETVPNPESEIQQVVPEVTSIVTPINTPITEKTGNWYLYFGLAGLSLGLISLIGILVTLVVLGRKKRL